MTSAAHADGRRAGTAQGIALIGVIAMPTLALGALVPDLPQLFQTFSAVPNHELLVPMIITVPSLCVALFSGVAGTIADFWGRRRLLIVSLLAFSILGLMPLMFTSLPAIIASRVVVGLAEAAILTAGNALMGDYFDEAQRKRWLGFQNMFGSAFGSLIILAGGFLADWHWRAPFLLYLIGFAVLGLVIAACWEPSKADAAPAASGSDDATGFPWRATVWVCGATLALSLIFFVQAVQHGRIFNEMGVAAPSRISILVTAASMGTIIGGYLFKRFAAVPTRTMLALSLVAYGCAYIGVAWAPSLYFGLPLDALGQIGGGIMLPALISWALTQYAFEHRGRGMGLWGGCFFLGAFVSPPVLSFIGRYTTSFLMSVAVIGVISLIAAALMMLRNRQAGAGVPA